MWLALQLEGRCGNTKNLSKSLQTHKVQLGVKPQRDRAFKVSNIQISKQVYFSGPGQLGASSNLIYATLLKNISRKD